MIRGIVLFGLVSMLAAVAYGETPTTSAGGDRLNAPSTLDGKRIGFFMIGGDGTGDGTFVAFTTTRDGSGRQALPIVLADTITVSGSVGNAGTVTTVSATRFMSGAFGAATTFVLPPGANWAVFRSLPLGLGDSSVSGTVYASINTASGQVDGGTGAPLGANTPVVWDNLDVGAMGVTVYFGSVLSGGAVPVSVEYGE